ncbi:MAG TPA: hypothetical protein VMW36_03395, partial [Patescibacteria group bacterium]|nr:hypothetical protein [Patescibacteria group bacterium]
MALKNLFGKKSQKIVSATTITDLGNEAESKDFVTENLIDKDRFVPDVDFSDPNNFAKFASAEKYYDDAINKIQLTYPYDGSLAEKVAWKNNSVDFQNYVFENDYPRTTGFVLFGQDYGTITTASSHDYDSSSAPEYIFFKGGPHAAVSAASKTLKTIFDEANIYEVDDDRASNLELNGTGGTTVEFMMKKDNLSGSRRQVIFDLWNSSSFGTADYGRFRIEVSGSSQFFIEYMSGSTGVFSAPIGQNLNFIDSGWQHYAFSIINTGSALSVRLSVT